MFELPENVIYELGRTDIIEDNCLPHTIKCKYCGCEGLKHVKKENGRWDLAYAYGKLKDKLHACG